MPPPDRLVIHIRVSPALLKRIKVTAAQNERSMNAEIVTRIEQSFELGGSDRAKAAALLTEALAILDGSG
jgi:hypothetical protein